MPTDFPYVLTEHAKRRIIQRGVIFLSQVIGYYVLSTMKQPNPGELLLFTLIAFLEADYEDRF